MLYQLKQCVWEVTLSCCFSCKYCGSRAGDRRKNELSTSECRDVAAQLAIQGCERVSLIGGEVFMRPDWTQIVSFLRTFGMRVSIITNGYLFTDILIHQIKEAGVESVAVSLDGLEPLHDQFRQPGSFRRADEAIDRLSKGGILVSIISTLNSENVLELEEFYQYLLTKRIFAWQLQACCPMGNARHASVNHIFDHAKVIQFVNSHIWNAPFSIGVADNIGYYTSEEGFIRGNLSGKAVYPGCQAGIHTIGIDSVGNVRGCESMYDERFNEGNLRERRLKDIWEDPNSFSYNRKFKLEMLAGKCSDCPHGDICRGGCRSYNYFTHGNLYTSPTCAHIQ